MKQADHETLLYMHYTVYGWRIFPRIDKGLSNTKGAIFSKDFAIFKSVSFCTNLW